MAYMPWGSSTDQCGYRYVRYKLFIDAQYMTAIITNKILLQYIGKLCFLFDTYQNIHKTKHLFYLINSHIDYSSPTK